MKEINVEAKLVKAVSDKTGNEYVYLDVILPNGYQTRLFFNRDVSFIALNSF